MRAWPFIALVLGWALAAIVLYQSGAFVERLHRYDGCTYVANLSPEPFWACPAETPSPEDRPRSEGEDQA